MPKRIQRSRKKGWHMPPHARYVGRPTIYGNPFVISDTCTAAEAVVAFRWYCDNKGPAFRAAIQYDLRGLDLACWCRLDQPCHADVLLEIANSPAQDPADEVAE